MKKRTTYYPQFDLEFAFISFIFLIQQYHNHDYNREIIFELKFGACGIIINIAHKRENE